MPDNSWMNDAPCRKATSIEKNQFFSVQAELQRAVIEAFCSRCDVRGECLEAAVNEGPIGTYGVRGGMTENDRRSYVRKLQRNKRGAA